MGELFPGLEMLGCYQWRVTRNSDLFVDEEEVTNLRHALQGELSQRNFGAAVRLEIDKMTPPELETFLQREFSLKPEDTYRVPGPVNLSRLMQLCNANTRPELLFPDYRAPVQAPFDRVGDKPAELFEAVAEQDRLLHHPYQSFQPVIDFLTAAALDPDVMAIKQTIYRTGEDSELMKILLAAARRQGGDGGGGADGALRRADQYQLGLQARGSGRARGLRRGGAQDARQDGRGAAPRKGPAAPLRPPGHRQLPSSYRAPVHRLRPADRRSQAVRGHGQGLRPADRAGRAPRSSR